MDQEIERQNNEATPTYYLETNSLIQKSKLLENPCVRENCFVSIHGIMELVTDLNDEVFGSKKAAIGRILNLSVLIDWRLPRRILFEAFGIAAEYTIKEEDVRQIMQAMSLSERKNDFENRIDQNGLKATYDVLTTLDSQYNTDPPRQLVEIENSYGDLPLNGSEIRGAANRIAETNNPSSVSFDSNLSEAIICERISKVADDITNSKYNSNKMGKEEILKCYNNKALDVFISTYGEYTLSKNSE